MKRNCEIRLDKFYQETESSVLLVEGARQVGKTYFIKNYLKKKDQQKIISINLEEEPQTRFEIDATKDFKEFTTWLEAKKGFRDNDFWTVYIDEAQESKRLGSYVRFMKENWKNTFSILSGSSMKKIFDGSSRVPVGRITYLTVWPFDFTEFLRFGATDAFEHYITEFDFNEEIPDVIHNELLQKYDAYLGIGGLPKVVEAFYKNKNYEEVLQSIIASQEDDFYRKEDKVKNYLFLDALKAVANNVGFPAKKTHITDNYYDATRIVSLLKQWYILVEVEQRGSIPKPKNFHPKWYVYDLGILKFLRETVIPKISAIRTVNEKLRTPLGGLIENAVLLSLLEGRGKGYEIDTWKKNSESNNPVEVDFVYKERDTLLPIEVKASLKIKRSHTQSLLVYLEEHGLNKGIIVSLDKPKRLKIKNYEIINIPAYLFSRRVFSKI